MKKFTLLLTLIVLAFCFTGCGNDGEEGEFLEVQDYSGEEEGKKITLKWTSSYSGQFDLTYGPITKTIVVESLF